MVFIGNACEIQLTCLLKRGTVVFKCLFNCNKFIFHIIQIQIRRFTF